MIDTIKLASPYLSEVDAQRIEQACVLRSAVEIATGDVQYALTTGSLLGSWDSRVSVRVEREEWVTELTWERRLASTLPARARARRGADDGDYVVEPEKLRRPRPVVVKRPSLPYLVIEGSAHKALMGHNIYGGPLAPAITLAWFVDNVGERLGLRLPVSEDWRVERVDWAEVFELPSFEACEEYITGLNMAQFPRRQVVRYGGQSLMAPGRTTAFKAYHKGPEFLAHDRKRLRECGVEPEQIAALQERANCILRLETEIKSRKLADDFGHKPLVVELTRDYLEGVHDREAARLLKEARNDVETVRTNQEVSRRLHETYDARLANILFGTWMQLAALGEGELRKQVERGQVSRVTLYRHKKYLVDAGVSWNGADVYVCRHSHIPAGFSPVRRDKHRLTEESDEVKNTLYMEYQRAV